MKFHHLARHNQVFGATHQRRSMSPIKHLQQNSSNHSLEQLAAAQLLQQHHLNNQNMTDDEDEGGSVNFFDTVMAEQQQQQQQQQSQLSGQVASTNSGEQANQLQGTTLDSNGFLIDKNKKLFPQKLWELIHNPSIQHCLRWSQDGQRVYLNRNEFETYYLKTPNNQFHTQKAISFVRQMNMYGFRKVDDCYYENDNFRRDQQHLLKNMIRRHPNKGLFAGLDHHQLAAAAAAQQALQVNHQLQQFEHQHKHRTEQALRLNNYLNSHQFHQHHHQQHQSNLAHHQHHSQHLKHSLPFDQMSSQLARAVNQIQQNQQVNIHHQLGENLAIDRDNCSANFEQVAQQLNGKMENQLTGSTGSNSTMNHQPKKSRLLNNFYATSNINGSANNNHVNSSNNPSAEQQNSSIGNQNNNNVSYNNNQIVSSQDSMHSTSSADTQPSQCGSSANSGSAGSPQPNSPKVNMKDLIKASRIDEFKFTDIMRQNQQLAKQVIGTDLTNHSMAARQAALHQTIVRSLLQLKHGQQQNNNNHQNHHHGPQDLIASIQQQQRDSRTLLESLASLSSVGTGSMVDPTSNSPTERTGSPPSGQSSPNSALDVVKCDESGHYNDDDNLIALNLAKSSSNDRSFMHHDKSTFRHEPEEELLEENDQANDATDETKMTERGLSEVHGSGSPLDAAKKVRKFLEDHMILNEALLADDELIDCKSGVSKLKLEIDTNEADDLPKAKRAKLHHVVDQPKDMSYNSVFKNLITEVCKRRGIQLHKAALNEAIRYLECFLDTLLDDASLIANHSQEAGDKTIDGNGELGDNNATDMDDGIIDASSLALALKLIPSKLLSYIQRQHLGSRSNVDEEVNNLSE